MNTLASYRNRIILSPSRKHKVEYHRLRTDDEQSFDILFSFSISYEHQTSNRYEDLIDIKKAIEMESNMSDLIVFRVFFFHCVEIKKRVNDESC